MISLTAIQTDGAFTAKGAAGVGARAFVGIYVPVRNGRRSPAAIDADKQRTAPKTDTDRQTDR
jgi:hypothetical protein